MLCRYVQLINNLRSEIKVGARVILLCQCVCVCMHMCSRVCTFIVLRFLIVFLPLHCWLCTQVLKDQIAVTPAQGGGDFAFGGPRVGSAGSVGGGLGSRGADRGDGERGSFLPPHHPHGQHLAPPQHGLASPIPSGAHGLRQPATPLQILRESMKSGDSPPHTPPPPSPPPPSSGLNNLNNISR